MKNVQKCMSICTLRILMLIKTYVSIIDPYAMDTNFNFISKKYVLKCTLNKFFEFCEKFKGFFYTKKI